MIARRLGSIMDGPMTEARALACDWTPLRWTEYCRIPSVEEIITDPGYAGPGMAPAGRTEAERRAREVIEADIRARPDLYSELDRCPSGFEFTGGVCKRVEGLSGWLLLGIAGAAAGLVVLLKA